MKINTLLRLIKTHEPFTRRTQKKVMQWFLRVLAQNQFIISNGTCSQLFNDYPPTMNMREVLTHHLNKDVKIAQMAENMRLNQETDNMRGFNLEGIADTLDHDQTASFRRRKHFEGQVEDAASYIAECIYDAVIENKRHVGDAVNEPVNQNEENNRHVGDAVNEPVNQNEENNQHVGDAVNEPVNQNEENNQHVGDAVNEPVNQNEENNRHVGDAVNEPVNQNAGNNNLHVGMGNALKSLSNFIKTCHASPVCIYVNNNSSLIQDQRFYEILLDYSTNVQINLLINLSSPTDRVSDMVVKSLLSAILCLKITVRYTPESNFGDACYVIDNDRILVMLGGNREIAYGLIQSSVIATCFQVQFNNFFSLSETICSVYRDDARVRAMAALKTEYCTNGELIVCKDSVNPMFMTEGQYCRVLSQLNDDITIKRQYFQQFRNGFDQMLAAGMPYTEIIFDSRLAQIIDIGGCSMLGLYFLDNEVVNLDLQGCRDIISGYIKYMEDYPNVTILIAQEPSPFFNDCCYHIKTGNNVTIGSWRGGNLNFTMTSTKRAMINVFAENFNQIRQSIDLNREANVNALGFIRAQIDIILQRQSEFCSQKATCTRKQDHYPGLEGHS